VVGAGGNAGAVAAGFLFKGAMEWNDVFLVIGILVTGTSLLAFLVRFSLAEEKQEEALLEAAHLETLQLRADRANAALQHSQQIVDEFNNNYGQPA